MKPYAIKIILQSPCNGFRQFLYRTDNKIGLYKCIRHKGQWFLQDSKELSLEDGLDYHEWLIDNDWHRIEKNKCHPRDYPSSQNIVDYT